MSRLEYLFPNKDAADKYIESADDLHWERCPVCKESWIAASDEDDLPICWRPECQSSFEAKVYEAAHREISSVSR